MKKQKQVKYGIEITKPWSKEMYAHNDEVSETIKTEILKLWEKTMEQAKKEYDDNTCEIEAEENGYEIEPFIEREYTDVQIMELREIQTAVTCYGFGMGFSMKMVDEEIREEIDFAAYFRLKEMAEDLELELEKEFIGFN